MRVSIVVFSFILIAVSTVSAFGTNCGSLQVGNREISDIHAEMPPNTKVAFIGDQNLGDNPKTVLKQIKEWGADMILHQG